MSSCGNELISIIVPVYNVEQYLEKCINSIINQTYKNLEIILVDDGATDNSGKMCDELAKTDNRIKVYHKENGGLSDARNYGVERAIGEYIGFVDSDDYIDEEMYEKLYGAIKKEDVDVAECNFKFIYTNRVSNYTEDNYYLVMNRDEYIKEYIIMNKLFGSACTKLIRSDLAKKIKFPKGKLYEDSFYSLELMKKAKNFVIFDSPYYNYVMRENSITNSKFNEKNLDLIEIADDIYDYVISTYPYLKKEADRRKMYSYFNTLDAIIVSPDYSNKVYYNNIKSYFYKNFLQLFINNKISINRKIRLLIMLINKKMYKKILLKHHRKLMGK
ncbi:MAG: glycosyltransferase [Gemella haemolysans]|uniref:glycosyltransferase family 2 protein n=1 Tax=Gemella haemolysans TaxID=1379 RepID=UPI00290C4320|nr:glycosyltransferase [Gemella haemolysans]MDU6574119.1 glycosyltransferase [Gemella haemolysans]